MKISNYLEDGANWQAQSVLAYLKRLIPSSFNIEVTRYDNCREQGYIFFCRKNVGREVYQKNVAVYEHRNSDALCIVVFDKVTFNDPINSDVWENMKDKYDTTESFSYGSIVECGNCIFDIFDEFISAHED